MLSAPAAGVANGFADDNTHFFLTLSGRHTGSFGHLHISKYRRQIKFLIILHARIKGSNL